MLFDSPLQISRLLLLALGTRMHLLYQDRVPRDGALLVVSNHRSFMDAPVLMAAINRPIRFACHHYMGQVPVMRDIVTKLGCFPLESAQKTQQSFFRQAIRLLQAQEVVGIFPEGAQPMIKQTLPDEMGSFQRGFAHLAWRVPVKELAVLPVAIAAQDEVIHSGIPLKLLSLIDPSEPLFDQEGWHPLVAYQRVTVLVGRPQWIRSPREQEQGKQAKSRILELTERCHAEINHLLQEGFY